MVLGIYTGICSGRILEDAMKTHRLQNICFCGRPPLIHVQQQLLANLPTARPGFGTTIAQKSSTRSHIAYFSTIAFANPNTIRPATMTSSSSSTMKAVVIHHAGGPEVLQIEQRAIPSPKPGEVLIRVKAFGLNRSEMYTRQGHSPGVEFPRILGIEATGIVESAPGGEFQKGELVMTAMGGMGRQFDGGYAQYTCVPALQVQAIKTPTTLGWEVLGALPEMVQTAWGALMKSLSLAKGDRLLVRGGTSSVGLTAVTLAKNHGAIVAATSRRPDREALLREYGADEFLLEDGAIAKQIVGDDGKFDKILELVGTSTLRDSLRCVKPGGTVSVTGIVGNSWTLENFSPMDDMPYMAKLTTYGGWIPEFMATPLDHMVQQIEAGILRVKVGKVFHIDQIVEAHRCMDDSAAEGKIVVLTD
jgi:NADPH:quinone reductase-like Zn-dependent oxidoreductase